MGFGTGLFLIAVGAILRWAVTIQVSNGFNWHTVGIILMIVGGAGMLLSLMFWGQLGRRAPPSHRRLLVGADELAGIDAAGNGRAVPVRRNRDRVGTG